MSDIEIKLAPSSTSGVLLNGSFERSRNHVMYVTDFFGSSDYIRVFTRGLLIDLLF